MTYVGINTIKEVKVFYNKTLNAHRTRLRYTLESGKTSHAHGLTVLTL